MSPLLSIVFYMSFDVALTKAYVSAQLRNYCAINLNPKMSMTVGDLLSSVITQMQLNAEGSISCTTIIADQAGDQYATGNTILIGFLFSFVELLGYYIFVSSTIFINILFLF